MIDSFKQVSWANTASIYEVNIRQYTAEGTFKAFQTCLLYTSDAADDREV